MNKLTPSNEDYLEAMLMLDKQYGKIKSVEIAKMLNVSKPGVNKAVNILKENGFIEQRLYGDIYLTDFGRIKAAEILEKHNIVKTVLIKLGVSKEKADIDCCLIEHVISDETFAAFKKFIKK